MKKENKENKDYKYLVSSLYCYFRQANEALNNIYNIIEENPEMMHISDNYELQEAIDFINAGMLHYDIWDDFLNGETIYKIGMLFDPMPEEYWEEYY